MRTIFSFFVFVSISVRVFSQSGFNKNFDPSTRMARCIDTIDDGYMVMGNILDPYVKTWLMRLDANGDTLWTKTYGTDSIQFKTYNMSGCADGGFILCGDYQEIVTSPEMDSYLMKVDSAGNIVWFNKYGVTLAQNGGKDFGLRCSELDNGTIITTGWAKYFYNQNDSVLPGGYFQGVVNAFDPAGTQINDRSFTFMFTSDTADYWSNNYITYDMKTIGNKIFIIYRDTLGAHLMGINESFDTLFTYHLDSSTWQYFGFNKVNNGELVVYGINYLAKFDTTGQLQWQINPPLLRAAQVHGNFNGDIIVLCGYDMGSGFDDVYSITSSGMVILSNFTTNGIFISSDTLMNMSPAWPAAPIAFDFINTVDSSIAFAGSSYEKFWIVKLNSTAQIPLSISPIYQLPSYNIYPNPAHNELFIEDLSAGSKIKVLSIDGKIIREVDPINNLTERISINFDAVSSGLYFLEITNYEGRVELLKFIID
ncbi:hypothetical protein BH11BAC7_BH11BAC7_05000 [soil metagenome]